MSVVVFLCLVYILLFGFFFLVLGDLNERTHTPEIQWTRVFQCVPNECSASLNFRVCACVPDIFTRTRTHARTHTQLTNPHHAHHAGNWASWMPYYVFFFALFTWVSVVCLTFIITQKIEQDSMLSPSKTFFFNFFVCRKLSKLNSILDMLTDVLNITPK